MVSETGTKCLNYHNLKYFRLTQSPGTVIIFLNEPKICTGTSHKNRISNWILAAYSIVKKACCTRATIYCEIKIIWNLKRLEPCPCYLQHNLACVGRTHCRILQKTQYQNTFSSTFYHLGANSSMKFTSERNSVKQSTRRYISLEGGGIK